MKIIFMGTPEFAVPSLRELVDSRHDVASVICQPDRPKGRGRKLASPPIKVLAAENSIPVLQPEKIKTDEFYEQLKDLNPDLICVTAYGKILPSNILMLPKYGCINVHASLLPKYRGAAPINWAIINGEKKTGITTMLMDEGMDTGDILLTEESEIAEVDTSIELGNKLSEIGAKLLIKTIDRLEANELTPLKQNDNEATYAPIIKKEVGKIDWNKNADEIRDLIRGTQPWPGAFTTYNDKNLKIYKATLDPQEGDAGKIIFSDKETLLIGTGRNSLNVLELQIEGGKRLSIEQFQMGNKLEEGIKLGI
ncbi:MAG: methionyl-tRNA formyltransferase [Thermodesulfobacteriota bacterium]